MLVLPENLRDKLKEPLGNLVDEQELLSLLQNEKYVVSVGDSVTFTLLKNGINPIICVVDYILERKECAPEMIEKIQRFGKKHIKKHGNWIGYWNSLKSKKANISIRS